MSTGVKQATGISEVKPCVRIHRGMVETIEYGRVCLLRGNSHFPAAVIYYESGDARLSTTSRTARNPDFYGKPDVF